VSDEEAGQIADLLMHVTRLIRVSSQVELAPVGLTHAQSHALRAISRANGPIRMAEIAARLDIVPRAATDVVDSLEKAGFVRRHADAADRRAILVSLTAKGTRLREQIAAARARSADSVLSALTTDERRQLHKLLSAIGGNCHPRRGTL